MRKEFVILVLLLAFACKRDEPESVTLTVVFSTVQPSTIDAVKCRAHLTGPVNLDTTRFVYRWDWESDQIWDTRYSAVSGILKEFDKPGDFMVTVEALSGDGTVLTAKGLLKVKQGFSAPVANFAIEPDSGNYKTVFTFDARLSRDAQESLSLLTYSWDFNNDQKFEVVEKGNPIAQFQFPAEGKYKVNLLVTDTSKLWSRITHEVIINRIDTLIVPVWQVEPEYPSDLDTIRLLAGSSYYYDKPQMLLRYSWKPYRGAWTEPSEEFGYTWIRPLNGTYLFGLRVYSVDDLYNEKFFEVVVSRANKQPTARVTRNMRFGNIQSVFEFSAWSSSDPDNVPSELMARWDFDGDGAWDTPFDLEKIVTRVYPEPGTYNVTLQVVDPGGLTAIAKTDIRVSPFNNPTSTLKDVRDERIYGIVKIGDQWWMGENLKWDMKQAGFGDYAATYCFNQNPAICEVTGRLYYAATVATDFTGESDARNLCPRGWHLPDIDEWLQLLQEVGRESAGSELFYGGSSDFNILMGGYAAYHHYGEFTEFEPDSLYKVAYFMTSPITGTVRTVQYRRNETTIQFRDMTPEGYYSVRCVKDN